MHLYSFLIPFGLFFTCSALIPLHEWKIEEIGHLGNAVENAGKCECKNGKCIKDSSGKEVCGVCNAGYGLHKDACKECKCGDGINCTFTGSGWSLKTICQCKPGYYSSYGKCKGKCECQNGKCVNDSTGKGVCVCNTGYGPFKDGCIECNCGDGNNCTFKKSADSCGIETICVCKQGYGLLRRKCKACDCGENFNCTFTDSFFVFSRNSKKTCICPKGYAEKSGVCIADNPCQKINCQSGGTCENKGGVAKCNCRPGYSGTSCEKTPCTQNPCKNGGTCKLKKPGDSNFTCVCVGPYSGNLCEKDPCFKNPCKNNGTCKFKKGDSNFICVCKDPYSGKICKNDPCFKNPCQNDGTCKFKRGDSNFTCVCKGPYSGKICENACECGLNANCVFKNRFFADEKFCFCPEGMKDHNGFCTSEAIQSSSSAFIVLLVLSLILLFV